MKKIYAFALLTATLPMLASCGSVVGALVPPQEITNPAGLTGVTLAPSDELQVESVRGTINYSTSTSNPPASFDDFKFPDNIPFNIRPHGLSFNTGFASATVTGLCSAPQSINVTLKSVIITVKDAVNSASIMQTPTLVLKLTRTAVGVGTASYSIESNKLTLSADASTSDAVISILTTGGKNDASFQATISADQNSLAGCRLSFTLGNTTATLSNFS
ncbi:hypothetical protein MF271_01930 (plasmid) [Deinococcus sp. KNUC1210]|uniref:hypothetical protein n=1 Tax=Deinococcus sp. KNUC1210 TaxID=2917691 RepID=UPI001EF0BA33|nr:hypothetical protein [Deinococcus sp. KNUC1210]ULH14302.1 hypothetical protein MF271_01930 [Deinococcus sp. KNUC1210]